jgi:pimeloyl-ACP methyl ester carboxylesterase
MPTIDLPSGSINYRMTGPERAGAPPVVFVHAFLVDGTVWSGVADLLAARGIRSYAPDWPLGAHRLPMHPGADQSPRGVARLILSFLEALDLTDITLVGNDTGGALAQFAIDMDPRRIGRVVLTNCDAFDTFPPFPFNVVFRLLKGEWRMKANLLPMRLRGIRHSPLGFGLLAKRLDAAQTRSWIEPALTNVRIRRDAVRFLRAMNPRELLDVSTRLKNFSGPVRIVWGSADYAFKLDLGRRLQQAFRGAELIELPDARTFVAIDAPEALADQIASFATPSAVLERKLGRPMPA